MLAVGATSRWLLAENKIPTGEIEPAEKLLVDRKAAALRNLDLDDVFGDLERDAHGRALMSRQGEEAAARRAARTELQVDRHLFAEPGDWWWQ